MALRGDRRLECGEQTGQTGQTGQAGQVGNGTRAHRAAGPLGSGSSATNAIEVFSPEPREAVKQSLGQVDLWSHCDAANSGLEVGPGLGGGKVVLVRMRLAGDDRKWMEERGQSGQLCQDW